MISKEMLEKMVEQQIKAKLEGNKSLAAGTEEDEPKVTEPIGPIIKKLDEIDGVKLENLLLKQQAEEFKQELENLRRKRAEKELNSVQENLQSYLFEKYEVDPSISEVKISAKELTLTILPR